MNLRYCPVASGLQPSKARNHLGSGRSDAAHCRTPCRSDNRAFVPASCGSWIGGMTGLGGYTVATRARLAPAKAIGPTRFPIDTLPGGFNHYLTFL